MRIALTGGIGAGKSTVSRMFRERGALVIDADAIAREVVAPGTAGLRQLAAAFGDGVLQGDGSLDRERLASIVFEDPSQLALLNAITHPLIAARSAELIATAPADAVVVYDMPLLAEQGAAALEGWDAIVVVDAPEDLRVARLVKRGMPESDARKRMAAQASTSDRLAIADHVIDNGGDEAALAEQVSRLWERLSG